MSRTILDTNVLFVIDYKLAAVESSKKLAAAGQWSRPVFVIVHDKIG